MQETVIIEETIDDSPFLQSLIENLFFIYISDYFRSGVTKKFYTTQYQ